MGGNGLTLSGGQRRCTSTVAGRGIAVPPLAPTFEYGTGNCLKLMEIKVELLFCTPVVCFIICEYLVQWSIMFSVQWSYFSNNLAISRFIKAKFLISD